MIKWFKIKKGVFLLYNYILSVTNSIITSFNWSHLIKFMHFVITCFQMLIQQRDTFDFNTVDLFVHLFIIHKILNYKNKKIVQFISLLCVECMYVVPFRLKLAQRFFLNSFFLLPTTKLDQSVARKRNHPKSSRYNNLLCKEKCIFNLISFVQ